MMTGKSGSERASVMDPGELMRLMAAHRFFLEGRPGGRLLQIKGARLAGFDLHGSVLDRCLLPGADLSHA
ncbi:hypothetical protein, partial [Streptomyces turgidiscabies]|uniref:hypothetical protein n=1 Tax=Streptomyces turgidiscabies TaxID=85558 RepID=UPI0038F61CC2